MVLMYAFVGLFQCKSRRSTHPGVLLHRDRSLSLRSWGSILRNVDVWVMSTDVERSGDVWLCTDRGASCLKI